MANSYASGTAVKSGYYLNVARWHVEPIEKDGMRLPEGRGSWVKVPTIAALVLVPLLGLTFLMFLPLIGFALFGKAIFMKVTGRVAKEASSLASTVAPGSFATGSAYLTGKPGEEKKDEGVRVTPELEKLAKEIEARKGENK